MWTGRWSAVRFSPSLGTVHPRPIRGMHEEDPNTTDERMNEVGQAWWAVLKEVVLLKAVHSGAKVRARRRSRVNQDLKTQSVLLDQFGLEETIQ